MRKQSLLYRDNEMISYTVIEVTVRKKEEKSMAVLGFRTKVLIFQ